MEYHPLTLNVRRRIQGTAVTPGLPSLHRGCPKHPRTGESAGNSLGFARRASLEWTRLLFSARSNGHGPASDNDCSANGFRWEAVQTGNPIHASTDRSGFAVGSHCHFRGGGSGQSLPSFPSSCLGTDSAKLLLGVPMGRPILESRSGASKTGVPKRELGNEGVTEGGTRDGT